MFPYPRPMHLILGLAIFLGILLPVSVVATPIPLPVALLAPDYSLGVDRSSYTFENSTVAQSTTFQSIGSSVSSDTEEQARAVDTIEDLRQYYNAAGVNNDALSSLAAQSANVDNNDYSDFQQQYASALSAFRGNLGGFQAAFSKASDGKGLEHYDRTNDLETLLKNTVNLNKEALQATYDTVNALPVVGPTLGPIVYEIKCLLESILDTVENYSDATINELQPLLAAVIGKAVTTTCISGVNVAGLCV